MADQQLQKREFRLYKNIQPKFLEVVDPLLLSDYLVVNCLTEDDVVRKTKNVFFVVSLLLMWQCICCISNYILKNGLIKFQNYKCFENKPIFFSEWYNYGMMFVEDMLHNTGTFLKIQTNFIEDLEPNHSFFRPLVCFFQFKVVGTQLPKRKPIFVQLYRTKFKL